MSDTYFENLPRFEYLNLLKNCEFIIGNSSSGIIESATFNKACINIGRRQNKRLCASNVVHVKQITEKNILNAIKKVKTKSFISNLKKVKNPYGDGKASKKIINILLNNKTRYNNLLKKTLTF